MRFLSILIVLAALSAACSGPYSEATVAAVAPAAVAPAQVRVERVEEEAIPEIVAANGELYAEQEATLGPKVPGRIAKLYVDLGDVVKAGQVLAELEKTDYEFRLRQAEALANQTRAKLGILGHDDDSVVPEETAIVKHSAAELKEARFIFQTTEALAQEGVLSCRRNVKRSPTEQSRTIPLGRE
ncbi:MAG: biotin/lipoyl-binding protein, partial [Acidobacteria bacterium]|nr:biotin/lipoyl-binding protein [Acidobacteriota bacterium]